MYVSTTPLSGPLALGEQRNPADALLAGHRLRKEAKNASASGEECGEARGRRVITEQQLVTHSAAQGVGPFATAALPTLAAVVSVTASRRVSRYLSRRLVRLSFASRDRGQALRCQSTSLVRKSGDGIWYVAHVMSAIQLVPLTYVVSPGWKDPSPVSVALPSATPSEGMNAASGDTRNGMYGFAGPDGSKPRMKQEGFK